LKLFDIWPLTLLNCHWRFTVIAQSDSCLFVPLRQLWIVNRLSLYCQQARRRSASFSCPTSQNQCERLFKLIYISEFIYVV
jgi:hypothetical protein